MHFNNPPVVEVGIKFAFEPDLEKQDWSLSVVSSFVDLFEHLPEKQTFWVDRIDVKKRSPQGIPEEFLGRTNVDRVSVRDKKEQHRLDVGNDFLEYRFRRNNENYPGFKQVEENAFTYLDKYIEHFNPTAVRNMDLFYFDDIRIKETSFDTDDYFQLGVKLPGIIQKKPVIDCAISLAVPVGPEDISVHRDNLRLDFRLEPRKREEQYSIRMIWQLSCFNVNSLNKDTLKARLSYASEQMDLCFKDCFTKKGLALFD